MGQSYCNFFYFLRSLLVFFEHIDYSYKKPPHFHLHIALLIPYILDKTRDHIHHPGTIDHTLAFYKYNVP